MADDRIYNFKYPCACGENFGVPGPHPDCSEKIETGQSSSSTSFTRNKLLCPRTLESAKEFFRQFVEMETQRVKKVDPELKLTDEQAREVAKKNWANGDGYKWILKQQRRANETTTTTRDSDDNQYLVSINSSASSSSSKSKGGQPMTCVVCFDDK